MNLFAIPANDQSIYYLSQIFGRVGNILPATTSSQLLGTMFKTFNSVMLVLGTLMIVYTTVVGLLATAHEGEFMGKKWSGLWVPIRSLIGIAALFPTATGYSALQVIIMWVIVQGVGAADMLWNTVLNYSAVAGSPFATVTIPTVDIESNLKFLFQDLSCQAHAKIKDPVKISKADNTNYYCGVNSGAFCDSQNTLDLSSQSVREGGFNNIFNLVYKMGPDGACGKLSYCDPNAVCLLGGATQNSTDQLKCAACRGQVSALSAIVSTLGKIAESAATTDLQYVKFYIEGSGTEIKNPAWIDSYCKAQNIKECCVRKSVPDKLTGIPQLIECEAKDLFPTQVVSDTEWQNVSKPGIENLYWPYVLRPYLGQTNYIDSSVNYYVNAVVGGVNSRISQLTPTALSQDWQKSAQDFGWLLAGSYYNKLAANSNSALDAARPTFTVTTPDLISPQGTVMKDYRNNLEAAKWMNDLLPGAFSSNAFATTSVPQLADIGSALNSSANGLMGNWIKSMTGGKDAGGGNKNPLIELQQFGKSLLITGEVLFSVFLVVAIAVAATGNFSAFVMGNGVLPGWGTGILVGLAIILPVFFGFLGSLFVFGGMLAVYVPMIPYIMFTLTAIGWFISTIEALIAAPLIALGILSPGGQHEILGRSEPALMLLLGVLLRPSLMIFGMMAAMLFAFGAVTLVNTTFRQVMGIIAGTTPGLTEMVIFMAVYTFLIIAVLNKCFSLIHLIPERVMTWIGGQAVSYGEGEGLAEVKRGAEGAAAGAGGAGAGALKAVKPVGKLMKPHVKGRLGGGAGT